MIRWGADASSDKLRQRARCTACGHKGATIQHPGWPATTSASCHTRRDADPSAHGRGQLASRAGNRELFDGVLVNVFIRYQRRARSGGHLHIDRHSCVERHRHDVDDYGYVQFGGATFLR